MDRAGSRVRRGPRHDPSSHDTWTGICSSRTEVFVRRSSSHAAAVCTIAIWCGWAVPASFGQDTRAAEIEALQAEKAQQLHPPEPTTAERVLIALQRVRLNPPPILPVFDSVYAGGSFTPGVIAQHPYGDRAMLFARGLYSVKAYKLAEVGTTAPGLRRQTLTLSARAGWRDATEVGYYGLGPDTQNGDRANYRFQEGYAEGRVALQAVRWFPIAGGVALEDYTLKSGKGSAPSIETVYTPATAPGLATTDMTFVHSDVRARIDTRPSPAYARTGGAYTLAWHSFVHTDDTYSFNRVDADAVQHIPILRETWVLSLHGRLQSTVGEDDAVPYFLMPSLGGGSSLRGYSSWRFRDRHSALGTVEWRWVPNRLALDMAVFYDAGTVAARRDQLNLRDLATDWGVGARFHAPNVTALRVEVAHGSEGWHIIFSSTAPF